MALAPNGSDSKTIPEGRNQISMVFQSKSNAGAISAQIIWLITNDPAARAL
jgi:hypothetical protein